ncbi:Rep [uncultured virus]|uniref:ATP-dependent helicase Rep n=1 Tax=uncultured virus TaxID=340016 RepID=A0A2K9LSA2_9VIRU|nr:Rep [uncultured virus]
MIFLTRCFFEIPRFLKERLRREDFIAMPTTERSRGWCFTMYGDFEEKESMLRKLPVQYACWGREIAPTTGRPHLQGYLYFPEKKAWGALKKIDKEAHWEAARKSPQANYDYCSKEGRYFEEIGVKPVMGARTDLQAVAEEVRNGASLQAIAEAHPGMFVQYSKGFAALKNSLMKDRTTKPDVTWVYGETGLGKTKLAVELCKSFYMKDGTQWWDGYEQQECIIVDDFDGKWPFRDLLRFLDRYKYQGQCKGGYVKINSPEIVITCEYPPSHFWTGSELAQIQRRITELVHLKTPKCETPRS